MVSLLINLFNASEGFIYSLTFLLCGVYIAIFSKSFFPDAFWTSTGTPIVPFFSKNAPAMALIIIGLFPESIIGEEGSSF